MTRVPVSTRTQYRESYEVLKIINRARKAGGLKPLTMDRRLLSNALTRAQECSVYYAHTRANGKPWHTAITKKFVCAGENIGFGFSKAETVTEAWMDSPSHRRNIMNDRYTCIGIGCVVVDGVTYWAQEFTDGRAKKISCPSDRKKQVKIAVADRFLPAARQQVRLSLGLGQSDTAVLSLDNAGYGGLAVQVARTGLKYSSSDRSVVTVTARGEIKAVGTGTASVKVKLIGNSRICRIYRITVVG